jgi:hypothetical protein
MSGMGGGEVAVTARLLEKAAKSVTPFIEDTVNLADRWMWGGLKGVLVGFLVPELSQQEQIALLNQQLAEAHKHLQDKQEEIILLQQQNHILTTTLATKDELLLHASEERGNLVNKYKQKRSSAKKERRFMGSQLKQKDAEIEQLKKELASSKATNRKLQSAQTKVLAAKEKKTVNLSQQVRKLQRSLKDKEAQMIQIQQEFHHVVAEAKELSQASVDTFKKELAAALANQVHRVADELVESIQTSMVAVKEELVAEVRSQYRRVVDEIRANFGAALDTKDQAIACLQEEVQALHQVVDEFKASVSTTESSVPDSTDSSTSEVFQSAHHVFDELTFVGEDSSEQGDKESQLNSSTLVLESGHQVDDELNSPVLEDFKLVEEINIHTADAGGDAEQQEEKEVIEFNGANEIFSRVHQRLQEGYCLMNLTGCCKRCTVAKPPRMRHLDVGESCPVCCQELEGIPSCHIRRCFRDYFEVDKPFKFISTLEQFKHKASCTSGVNVNTAMTFVGEESSEQEEKEEEHVDELKSTEEMTKGLQKLIASMAENARSKHKPGRCCLYVCQIPYPEVWVELKSHLPEIAVDMYPYVVFQNSTAAQKAQEYLQAKKVKVA